MVEEEEAATRALNPVGSRALKGLFSPEPLDRPEAADPEVLMRLATLASGRAMTGRLWAKAKALAGLAESYGRISARVESAAPTIQSLPLQLIYDIQMGDPYPISERFFIDPDVPEPEATIQLKAALHRTNFERRKAREAKLDEISDLKRLVERLEAELAEARPLAGVDGDDAAGPGDASHGPKTMSASDATGPRLRQT